MSKPAARSCDGRQLAYYRSLSKAIRLDVLEMTYRKKAAFIGTSFSCADVLAVLYGGFLGKESRDPRDPEEDTFLLSKGHGASAWYAALANMGYFPRERLSGFNTSGSYLGVHPKRDCLPGVTVSSGSLGHGLGLGCGLARAKRLRGGQGRVCVLLGDGECNEGSVWESVMFAHRFEISNLIAIVDRNRLQSYGTDAEVLDMDDMAIKFAAFGWKTINLDGHDHEAIHNALAEAWSEEERPVALIADTVKGKGCSLFENLVLWHYKWPEEEHYLQARKELEQQ